MAQTTANAPTPPIAKRQPKKDTLHGDLRVDDYYWLREKSNPEVISYLEAENAYTDAIMKPYEGLQTRLYQEILGRIKEDDLSVPYRQDGYFYYSRTEKGKQYAIYCRKHENLNAPEEVILDLNELAQGEKFCSLGFTRVSPNGKLLAYSLDNTGFRQFRLFIKDLTTGKLLPEQVERVDGAVWAEDNHTLFYITEDEQTKRANRAFRHTLGSTNSDALVYEEKDELYRIGIDRTDSRSYVVLTSVSATTTEQRVLRSNEPQGEFRLLLPREEGHEYYLEHHGDRFYFLTNKDAKNFRLVSAPVDQPGREHWREEIAHHDQIKLGGMKFFVNHYVVYELAEGLTKLRITDLRNGQSHRVEFPETAYSAGAEVNAEFNSNVFRFAYQSLVTPNSVYDYNMDSQQRVLLKQTEVLGGYDATKYQSERIYATSTDGVKIPISLVYRKDLQKDGARPLYLYGYGAYGFSLPVTFKSSRLSLLDRGVIYAIAHVRGGSELGDQWHDQGKMMLKRNTFTDFINVAEHLIAEKYTASDRLIIEGRSAGGLLMGAVTNMRPELFKAVIAGVPFVDVINTMLDETLPLTVGEFLEWGNPKVKNEYDYLKSYCPYTNITPKAYPNMLVKTSLNDSQVMYWEPAKYVAKLRATKTDQHQLLFKINMAGGHGGASGRYDALKDDAFDYSFILSQLGITQ